LENEHLRAAVGLWRLYFETGRWHGDFLANGMTASGRQEPVMSDSYVFANSSDSFQPS
jgi:hypothetical protein